MTVLSSCTSYTGPHTEVISYTQFGVERKREVGFIKGCEPWPPQRWRCQVCGGTVCWGHSGSVGRAAGWARSWRLHSPLHWSQNGGCPTRIELWPWPSWPLDPPQESDTRWGRNCSLCSVTRTGGEHRSSQINSFKHFLFYLYDRIKENWRQTTEKTDLFDMTECTLRAVGLWDDPPQSLHWTPMIPVSGQDPFIPPDDAPSPPRGESVRRTESDPHFGLLDHIQVLTRDSNDSASPAKERRTEKKTYQNIAKPDARLCEENHEYKWWVLVVWCDIKL